MSYKKHRWPRNMKKCSPVLISDNGNTKKDNNKTPFINPLDWQRVSLTKKQMLESSGLIVE